MPSQWSQLGGDGARYAALEFTGSGVASLDIADRLVISNMVVEMGAKAGIFPCDDLTLAYLRDRAPRHTIRPTAPDKGASYARALHLADAADLVRIRHTLRQIVNVKGD